MHARQAIEKKRPQGREVHRIASQMLQLSHCKAEAVKQLLEKADRPRAVCLTKTPMGWLALADQMLHRGHDGDVRVVLFRWSFESDQLSVRHESRDELLRARKARVLLDVCDERSRVALLPNSVVLFIRWYMPGVICLLGGTTKG